MTVGVRKSSAFAVVTLALGILWFSPTSATAAGCSRGSQFGTASTCAHTVGWTYDPESKSFDRAGMRTSAGDTTGDRYAYESYNVCTGDQSTLGCGARAFTCPPVTAGGAPGHRIGVVRWLILPDGSRTPGPGESSTACDYPSRSIPVVDVEALARRQIEKAVSHPKITVAPPGGKTLVNIPTVFSAPEPKPVTLTITTPVPGTITAIPEYTWDFGDGLTGVGAGIPYHASVNPMKHPDSYLHAVYQKGGPKHITATLTWNVTFALQGTNPVDLAPIVFTSTADIRVMTARSRLYKS